MGFTTVASFLLGLGLAQDLSPVELQRKASEQRLAARYTEAETLYTKALVLLDREHPPDSAILLPVLDGLALLHLGLNRLEKAQSLSQRAVTLIDNADTLSAASTLAVRGAVLQASGDLPGAMESFRRSLAIRESMLGVDDSLTLDVRTQIAALTQLQGKTQEAIGLYRSLLASYEGRRDARDRKSTRLNSSH